MKPYFLRRSLRPSTQLWNHFNQSALDSGLSLALSSVTGNVGFDSVVRNVAMKFGMEPRDVQQRIEFTMDAYQVQTDHYAMRNGIAKEDLAEFYEFARASKQD